MRSATTAPAITGLALRRTWKGALTVAATSVLVTVTAVLGYVATYPDPAERVTLAQSIGSNPGLTALFGETRDLESVAGFTEWRVVLMLAVIGAVWMLFATTRVLRGEEEAGRCDLLLAGPIDPARAAAAAILGLVGSLLILLAATTLGLWLGAGGDLGPGRGVLLALTLASTPAAMLGIGALTSQLAQTRRRALGLGAAVLVGSYLVRVVADSSDGLRWLRWAGPLGWLEIAHPLTEPRALAIVLPYALGIGCTALALGLVGLRDTGAGLWAGRGSPRPRTAGLFTPMGLAARMAEGSTLAWMLGLGLCGALIGLVARTAAQAMAEASGGANVLGGLGIEDSGAKAYVSVSFVLVTLALAVAAAGQVSVTRDEEASGRVDNLLVRPVGRVGWLVGRIVVSLAALALAAGAAALGAIAAGRAAGLGVTAGDLAIAGANCLPAAVFILGAGTLLHGLVPRLAAPLTYALVVWSFLLEIVGSTVGLPGWLLGMSVLHHVAPAPAASPDWASAAVLLALGFLLASGGAVALSRRDVQSA